MFSNCGEFVMKISISLSIVNDVTDLICDGPKFRVSYIEQRDVVVFEINNAGYSLWMCMTYHLPIKDSSGII